MYFHIPKVCERSVSKELRVIIPWTFLKMANKHLLKAISRPWTALGSRDILVKQIESSYSLIWVYILMGDRDKQVTMYVVFQIYKEKWSLIGIGRVAGLNIQFADLFHKVVLSIWLWVMPYNNLSKAVFSQGLNTLVTWDFCKLNSQICLGGYIMLLFGIVLTILMCTAVKKPTCWCQSTLTNQTVVFT